MTRFVLLASFVFATGCEVDLDSRVETVTTTCAIGSATVCQQAVGVSDFTWIHDHILTTNCTGTACHESDSSSNAKNTPFIALSDAYASLVGKASNVYKGQTLVVANHPEQSILLLMTQEIPPEDFDPPQGKPPDDVGFMPQASGALCCQKLDAMKAWINAGAPNI